ncbi:MAG: hypothetical protein IKC30_03670 [Rikenellaceae bacterium]|nr:hypothetical protein [Rikenellaceae bacterium]
MKRFLTLILLAATLVGCEKYDDDRVDKYVENEMKSIDADRANAIVAKAGEWKWVANKTVVYTYNADGSTDVHKWGDEPASGLNYGSFRFGEDAFIYTSPISETSADRCYGFEIDWALRTIELDFGKILYISGITENYLVVKDNYPNDCVVATFMFVAD